MKKQYCCLQLEDAVIRGWIWKEPFIDDKPQHDMFITEFVTNKRKSKQWLIFTKEQIDTKEIILKNCLWCSAPLV